MKLHIHKWTVGHYSSFEVMLHQQSYTWEPTIVTLQFKTCTKCSKLEVARMTPVDLDLG